MAAYWTFLKIVGQFNVWKSADGAYNLTQTRTPPVMTAGYYDLDALLRMKGLT